MHAAADVASREGLDGISIGGLAETLGMSKSGVIGPFGSKEELQLAATDYAVEVFRQAVWVPVQDSAPGLPRLLALCDAWVAYASDPGFSGGCCVVQISYDLDARTGRVHDHLARRLQRWRTTIMSDVAHAVGAGDLPEGTDPGQIAFSLEAIASGITPARRLHGEQSAPEWARRSMRMLLGVASD